MNLQNLKTLSKDLPKGLKENASNLLTRMEEVVEGIGDEPIRWKPSLLKLVQGTTDRTTIPKGTAIGDFVLGQKMVERPMKFIPLRIWEGRQYWSPDPNEAKLLCSSPDAKLGYIGMYCNQCPHSKYDEVAKKSECSKTQNVISITADFSDIFVATFAKTNYKIGMDLKSKATAALVSPYRRIYSLDSQTNSQYKNVVNYELTVPTGDDSKTKEDLVPFLKELFDIVGADRKEALDKFHTLVLSRAKTETALPAPDTDNDSVELLPASATDETAELAKNYQV